MKILVINNSSAEGAAMPLIVAALQKYAGMVADAWGVRPPDAIDLGVSGAAAPPGFIPMTIGDTIDDPGALAYHSVGPDGVPLMVADFKLIPGGELFHDPSGCGASLLDTLQHELAEFLIDPFANAYMLGPFVDAAGKSHALQALEICDPVQESAGAMDVNGTLCDVADFVLPSYFCPSAKGPFDHLGVLTRPLSLAGGGYAIVEDGDLTDNQVMARAAIAAAERGDTLSPDDHAALERAARWVKVYHPSRPAAWREALKNHPGSRSARRLADGLPKLHP